MRAAIVAVGSELLGADRLDTNSLRTAAVLHRYGVEIGRKAVVGDRVEDIAGELARCAGDFELALVTGGLGPTADDVTRQAVAHWTGRSLRLDEGLLSGLEARFASLNLRMPEVNRRQALVVEGSEPLFNPLGTAPGLHLVVDRCALFVLPGVPAELDAMVELHVEPWLRSRTGGAQIETAVVKVACLPESVVEERIRPAYEEFGRESITVLGSPGEVRLQVVAHGPLGERRRRLSAMTRRLRELVGRAAFSDREEEMLEAVVGRLLAERGARAATAESCTGGLIAERLTRVPGASAWFEGGVVVYSNRLKTVLLGVGEDLLSRHGAVSEEVALAMASGARSVLGAEYGVAVTGVAGPTGGTPDKPVGTVHLAVLGPGPARRVRCLRLPGDRERVRWLASQWALEELRRALLERVEEA